MKLNKENGHRSVLIRICLLLMLLDFYVMIATAIPNLSNLIPDKLFGIVSLKKKIQYTPLLFFTVPKGLMPECDAMEKIVSDVEKELKIKVERMDVLRKPQNELLLQLITTKSPPFLYHRESCQSYSLVQISTGSGKKQSTGLPIYIDKDKVRAWAKGRYIKLLPRTVLTRIGTTTSNRENVYDSAIEDASNSISVQQLQQEQQQSKLDQQQQDMLEDMALTPDQRKGKKLIKERTEALREDAIRKREIKEQKQQATLK